jgi:hypothetical protein
MIGAGNVPNVVLSEDVAFWNVTFGLCRNIFSVKPLCLVWKWINEGDLQARIVALNAHNFLKNGGHFVISIKVKLHLSWVYNCFQYAFLLIEAFATWLFVVSQFYATWLRCTDRIWLPGFRELWRACNQILGSICGRLIALTQQYQLKLYLPRRWKSSRKSSLSLVSKWLWSHLSGIMLVWWGDTACPRKWNQALDHRLDL